MESSEGRSTSSLSNTVCISDPDGQWPAVQPKAVKDLSEFGEIARLDTSLVAVARCVLVTFFDVRSAQRVMLSSPSRCEPFPPAAHDCRTVCVNLAAFAEKVDHVQGGFNQFGEVANITAANGQAIVEFYDIRAAQMLLAASQGTATPWTPEQSSGATAALLASLGEAQWPPTPEGLLPVQGSLFAKEEQSKLGDFEADPDKGKNERGGNRPVRTKVSTKEFQKYDIDPDAIQAGADSRTTVMVRNLSGVTARKEFLTFLEKCGLGDRYSFFYMPCKEHRNIPAGFAFINFISPIDVHKLYIMVKSGFWREFMEPSSKAPGMSYARFQGHEELAKHFSSSAVLHEQDAEKRPIFRPEAAAKAAQERQKLESQKVEDRSGLLGAKKGPATVSNLASFHKSAPSTGLSGPPGLGGLNGIGSFGDKVIAGDDLGLLSSGVNKIAAILERGQQTQEEWLPKSSSPPAYVKSSSMSPPYPSEKSQQALQVLLAAKNILDSSNYFPPQQMGA
eukprot:TRINITY_DN91937_c0_g1_i1.p1 TRINITY_DN91937_c0_g1~~TRINITY_DN91937_c0_g1_i1.p1  ORF type:complete len:546 (-),score=130.78 TRINITY_DN91937_c0_g1_i1:114-1631(-)